MRVWISVLVLLSALAGRQVTAEVVKDLYVAEVPVASQDREERQLAIGTALREVLVRVTGRSLALTVTPIEEALLQPTRYVQRYRYVKRQEDAEKGQFLWVRFDEKAVNKLLRDNQLPVWGKTRPVTLVWLVIDNRRERVLISNDKIVEARHIIEAQSRLRGLPLRFPLYDLADRATLGVTDVWGNFEDTILQASSRYHTEAVLVGRVYMSYGNSWSGRWTLYSEGRRQDWESRGETLEVAIMPGVGQAADILAQRYAQSMDTFSSGRVLVQIEGVNSLQAYNRTVQYLNSLGMVSKVQPKRVSDSSVLFELTSRRGRDAVSQAIALGHTLIAQAATPMDKAVPQNKTAVMADLTYRLVP